MPLTLRCHDQPLSLCRLPLDADVPANLLRQPLSAFLRTHGESTLICPTANAPQDVQREDGFIALEFVGPFDFALTGIMNQISVPLAAANISIIALSTFDTDYLLIKAGKKTAALETLRQAGHILQTPAGEIL